MTINGVEIPTIVYPVIITIIVFGLAYLKGRNASHSVESVLLNILAFLISGFVWAFWA